MAAGWTQLQKDKRMPRIWSVFLTSTVSCKRRCRGILGGGALEGIHGDRFHPAHVNLGKNSDQTVNFHGARYSRLKSFFASGLPPTMRWLATSQTMRSLLRKATLPSRQAALVR